METFWGVALVGLGILYFLNRAGNAKVAAMFENEGCLVQTMRRPAVKLNPWLKFVTSN